MKKILNIIVPTLILLAALIIVAPEAKAQTSFESWVSASGSREGTVAAVGESIGYSWWSNGAVSAASTYTADTPDNCPGGITSQGEVKPWIASTLYGSGSATVQECQAWHTYTINYTVKNSANSDLTKSLTVKTFPRCEGEIYTSGPASQVCASLAEQIGKSLGYSISCTSMPACSPVPDPMTGLNCYYTATCNVNGNQGQGAEKLAGYAGFSGNISSGNKSFLSWSSQTSGWSSAYMPPISTTPPIPTTSTTPTTPVSGSAGNTTSQTAYISSLISVVNNMIEKYKSMIANTNTIATNTNTTTTGVNTSVVTVTVNADVLNVRSAPNTQASILSKLNAGNSFTATCYVVGESVEGSSKWWKTSSGSYVWAGGTLEQPSGANVLCGSTTSTPSTIVPIITSIPNVSLATISTFSKCIGEIYSDAAASQACATLAETQGKALGYTITCTSQKVGLLYPEPNTGLMYYFNAICTVNGYEGQGAQLLAGYTGFSGIVNGRSLSWSGNDQGWETLAVNLRSMEAAKICGGTNYGFNQATNQYYCLSSSQIIPVQTTSTTPSAMDSRIQQIISGANVLQYSSLTAAEKDALFAYLSANGSALINQNFSTFAPGSVFAWALSMGTSTTLNAAAKSLGFTTYNPVAGLFVKTPGYTIQ